MPKFDAYYVVEFRIPIKIEDSDSVHSALSKASRICQRQYGFKPDNWFARVFEYISGESVAGVFKEYFYNPHSSTYREIKKNHGYHNELFNSGGNPNDDFDFNKIEEEIAIGNPVHWDGK